MEKNKKNRILAITAKNPQHGLNIYQRYLETLIHSTEADQFSFSPVFFDAEDNFLQKNKNFLLYSDPILAIDKPDLIHLQYDTESFFHDQNSWKIFNGHVKLFLSLFFNKLPVVLTMHGFLDDEKKYKLLRPLLFVGFIFPLLLFTSITIVFHSQTEVERFSKIFPTFRKKFIFIPHLIYPKLLTTKVKKKTKKIYFGTLGNIGEWKGQLDILKIIKKLSLSHHNFQYIIAGSKTHPQYAQKCFNYIQKNKLEKTVLLVDHFLSELEFSKYLTKIDIYLSHHTRLFHSSSGTIAYAIAAGKIVVSTNIPYVRDKKLPLSLLVVSSEKEYLETLKSLLDQPIFSQNVDWEYVSNINKLVIKTYIDVYKKSLL